MTERLIEKLDRLGAEAGIKQMTPEVYRFALDVRKDLVAEWPKRPWVDLSDSQIEQVYYDVAKLHRGAAMPWGQIQFGRALQALIKEKNT
jgi:hypothetical protein